MLAALLTVAMLAQPIEWRAWTPALFEQARREKRFVLLDLEAVWCHWCHVMDATTYADAKVVALVRAHYLAARVDEDSDPPLSERYGDYGWPATIVLDGEGRDRQAAWLPHAGADGGHAPGDRRRPHARALRRRGPRRRAALRGRAECRAARAARAPLSRGL